LHPWRGGEEETAVKRSRIGTVAATNTIGAIAGVDEPVLLFWVKAARKAMALKRWSALAVVVAALWTVHGSAKEGASPKDDPVLGRVPGSAILTAERKDNDTVRVPMERIVFNLQSQKFNAYRTAAARGQGGQVLYALPAGTSLADASHYYEEKIRQANGELLFSGSGDALDNGNDRFVDQVYRDRIPERIYNLLLLNRNNAYVAGRFNEGGNEVYAQVYLFENSEGRNARLIHKGRLGALVETVTVPPTTAEASRAAAVTSQQMASEINRTGRIALYGLYFDTNRTDIKPESRPTLEQIADLLKRQPDLKLLVVGHTDNVGDFEPNRDLSQRRAASVVNALVTGFGIAPDRLVPFGVSYACPVASNGTAEGRGQNRRVELVRY
jgi:OmpA-OmpF porin, OOP family